MKWNSQSLCQWSSCHVRYVLNVCTVGATSLVCLEAWGSVWLNSSVVHLSLTKQSQVSVYLCMLLAFAFFLPPLSHSSLSSISLSLSFFCFRSVWRMLVCVWECREGYCCVRSLFYIGVRLMWKSMFKCSPDLCFLLEVFVSVDVRTFLDLCVLYSHTYKLK